MPIRAIDLAAVRRELRTLTRGNLLILAERATQRLSTPQLRALLADVMPLHDVDSTASTAASLSDEVAQFHAASMGGQFYEACPIGAKGDACTSRATDAFIAEFDRLIRQCIRAAPTAPPQTVRDAFERLFNLLRHLDKGNDDLLFFADDGGSLDIGVDWHAVFPVYFRCVAQTTSADVFREVVDQVIRAFASAQRPHHVRTAGRAANPAQKRALRTLADRPTDRF